MNKILSQSFAIALVAFALSACGKSASSNTKTPANNPYLDPYADPNYDPYNDPYGCGGCNLPPVQPPCGGCNLPPILPPTPLPIPLPCGGCNLPPTPTPIPGPAPTPVFDSGFYGVWGGFQQCVEKTVSIPIPRAGKYYLSFKGTYTGWYEDSEWLQIKVDGGSWHNIKDLDDSYKKNNGIVKKCKVPVAYSFSTAGSYKVHLVGNDHDVTNTFVRFTSVYPGRDYPSCE